MSAARRGLDEDEMGSELMKSGSQNREMTIINELGIVIENNRPVVSSRKVAEVFEKEHRRVMQDIRELGCDSDFNAHNFVLISYIDSMNREKPEYLMTRLGFSVLTMGFNGAKAMQEQSRMTKRIQHSSKTS